jgi:hypothetical protein
VSIINLIDFPGTKSAPLGSLKFGIDSLVFFPPFDVLAPNAKKKWSYDLT